MMRRYLTALTVLPLSASLVAAQEPEPPQPMDALLVFLDCNAPYCDFSHFRREITWVNWVRDRQDADMHLLVTAQITGGGGWDFTLDYIGLRALAGRSDTLRYVSDPTDVDAEIRDGLTQTMALGLVRYAAATGVAPRLQITFQAPQQQIAQASQKDDPWNLWVFRISANGSLDAESQERGYSVRGNASANRTSEDFKFDWRANFRTTRDEFDYTDETTGEDTTVVNTTENWGSNLLLVWSLDDHWSIGGTASMNHSTRNNYDLAVSGGPAIEYNIFPYDESTRRSITFLYSLEVAGYNYELVTVERETAEVLPRHSLEISVGVQQPWGQIGGSVTGIQYLHDLKVHRISTRGFLEFRIFRGLNFNLNGSVDRIKDQFFLPAVGLTQEEILLRRRQRETDFRYRISMGFSYRFGSRFANIVNPRFGGGGFFFF